MVPTPPPQMRLSIHLQGTNSAIKLSIFQNYTTEYSPYCDPPIFKKSSGTIFEGSPVIFALEYPPELKSTFSAKNRNNCITVKYYPEH